MTSDLRASSNLQLFNLSFQLVVFLLDIFKSFLQGLHLLLSAGAELLNDLENTPETQHNNKRSNFLERTFQHDVNQKTD